MDAALKQAGITEERFEKPTKTLADIPFIRAFIVRYPTSNSESIRDFYDNYKKADRIRKTAKRLIEREAEFDKAMGLLQEGQIERLDNYYKSLQNVHKMIDRVYIDPNMTGDEKREFIDILYLQMISIAGQGNKIFKELEK